VQGVAALFTLFIIALSFIDAEGCDADPGTQLISVEEYIALVVNFVFKMANQVVSLLAGPKLFGHLRAGPIEELAADLLSEVVARLHEGHLVVRLIEHSDEDLHEHDVEDSGDEASQLLSLPDFVFNALYELGLLLLPQYCLLLLLDSISYLLHLLDSLGNLDLQVLIVL